MSGICPKFYTGQILDIFWTKSGYVKILDIFWTFIFYRDKESETSNNKKLLLDICKIIDSEVWWKEIRQLEKLLLPFYEALNKLQSENARLHDVLHSFGYFYKIWLTKIWGKNDFMFGNMVSSQEDGLFQVSNDNDDQDPERDIESSCEWRNLINEWIEMVDEDEQINQTNEENSENLEPLIERVMNLDQILRNNTHLLQKC
ncbi:hypothetical protein RhiirA5_420148 [Rhizophagus irregularis]|uniref:Uncharacterized protein n=1 Tax=Rhizophagus irregularis TaxID=588596 RepID=A0A2N0PGV5_9GLOM|nr:hypothetical protein RhiirA5_420148 [Rhizophagus irregularis]